MPPCSYVDKHLESYALLGLPNSGPPPETKDEDMSVFYLAGKVVDRWKAMYNTQLGGTYVVAAGGAVLMEHRQVKVGDYVENGHILKALNIFNKQ